MADVEVEVLHRLQGDETFERGAMRTLSEADAKRLGDCGAVRILSGKKADAPLLNKAEAPPKNKRAAPVKSSD